VRSQLHGSHRYASVLNQILVNVVIAGEDWLSMQRSFARREHQQSDDFWREVAGDCNNESIALAFIAFDQN
jgi:hypothetical protein